MEQKQRALVLERLRELEGWAEYITEALHLDQNSEPAQGVILERTLDEQALRKVRELSSSLRDKLQVVAARLELSRSS